MEDCYLATEGAQSKRNASDRKRYSESVGTRQKRVRVVPLWAPAMEFRNADGILASIPQ